MKWLQYKLLNKKLTGYGKVALENLETRAGPENFFVRQPRAAPTKSPDQTLRDVGNLVNNILVNIAEMIPKEDQRGQH